MENDFDHVKDYAKLSGDNKPSKMYIIYGFITALLFVAAFYSMYMVAP